MKKKAKKETKNQKQSCISLSPAFHTHTHTHTHATELDPFWRSFSHAPRQLGAQCCPLAVIHAGMTLIGSPFPSHLFLGIAKNDGEFPSVFP